MSQITFKLTINEGRLMTKIPAQPGDVRTLVTPPTREEDEWWSKGTPIKMSTTKFVCEAIRKAYTTKLFVNPYHWRRFDPKDTSNNPDNDPNAYNIPRTAINVPIEIHNMVSDMTNRYKMASMAETTIWAMYNYSEYLRLLGKPDPQERHMRRKYSRNKMYGDTTTVTLRIPTGVYNLFDDISSTTHMSTGRAIREFLMRSYEAAEKDGSLYDGFGITKDQVHSAEEDEVTEVIDMAEPEGFKKAIDLMLPTVDDTYNPEDTMDVATEDVTGIDPDGFDPEAFGL